MAQINIKQIRGASQGSLVFLGTNSVLSENYNRLNWDQNTNQLFINGQLKIQDGNQQSGYVLTSDNDGLAQWSPIIATSGLSKLNGEIILGGTLSQNTTIDGQDYQLSLVNFDYLFFTSSLFDVESSLISLDAGTGSIQMIANDSINLAVINGDLLLSANIGTVNVTNGEGLVYSSDYSGTFVTNSLVSKKYVDIGTASIWSAINSLSDDGITGVTASYGLTGGGASGYVTLSVELGSDSGLTFSGNSLIIDPSIAGVGLTFSQGSMSVDLNSLNGITGSGTINYISKFITSSSLGNSIIQDDGSTVIINGNLTVTGTATTVNTQNLLVQDPIILLASTQSGAPLLDQGLMFNRGTGATQAFIWDESDDKFTFIQTNDSSTVIGNIGIVSGSDIRALKYHFYDTGSPNSFASPYIYAPSGGSIGFNAGNIYIQSPEISSGDQSVNWNTGSAELKFTGMGRMFRIGAPDSGGGFANFNLESLSSGASGLTRTGLSFSHTIGSQLNDVIERHFVIETKDSGSYTGTAVGLVIDMTGVTNSNRQKRGLRIVDGTQNNGNILISDANGYASWTSSSIILSSLSGVTGSGTTNYIPKWNSTSGLSSTSSIYDNGNVGIGTTNPQAKLNIVGNTTSIPVFKVDGVTGELFSITDSLDGSLFSVNDISGLPILEVFSDNTTLIGDFQARSLYTTKKTSLVSGTNSIYSFATASYTGAFVDYTLISGSNARAGSINAVWLGSNIQFSETSTLDIGTTSGVTFSFVISGTYAVFQAHSDTNWQLKTIIRSI